MDILKKYFPLSFGAADIAGLVIKIIIYIVIGAVAGCLGLILGIVPIVGGILAGILDTLCGLYSLFNDLIKCDKCDCVGNYHEVVEEVCKLPNEVVLKE